MTRLLTLLRLPKTALTALLLTIALTLAATLAVSYIRTGPPLIVMQLRSEILVQRVARPELSSIAVTNARLAGGEACNLASGGLFSGVMQPPEGAILTYQWAPTQLRIQVDAPPSDDGKAAIRLSDRAEGECSVDGRLQMLVALVPGDSSAPAWQLPIAGPAQAGSEFGSPLAPAADGERVYDLLRGGTVSVFGKSVDGGMLFPIADSSFEIPAGSRIASSDVLPPGTGEAGPSWYGVATYGPDGFDISATAESKELRLFRPGAGRQSETFGIGLLAGILGDPGTVLLAFALAAFFAIGGLVVGWMSLWRDPPPGKSPDITP